ncbi:Sec-independent protein translocase protein TatB [Ciceribacter ferrooxidans]|uniref:Sec-independent protein translocase protein TatB n=1 Tax=Ciceribacter ferrooxidans TaxID=2509717 RepID=A0A4Q2TJB5_9HYPH|nr:Sec-independent protein translocase protein TatB [Ciceribacter ferrooxidans]RYC17466.1 twin-arginine translocase subunit TatB [Ciceribacter ferrooxidans]
MLDIGWTELLVIAVILIVVVGPKDLPPMIRAFGKMTARLRKTAGEFRAQFDEALREAELDELRQTVNDVRSLNPANALRDAVNPLRQAGNEIKSELQKATTPDVKPAEASPETVASESTVTPVAPPMAAPVTGVPPELSAPAVSAVQEKAKPAAKRLAKPKGEQAAAAPPAKAAPKRTVAASKKVETAAKPAARKPRTAKKEDSQ